MTRRFDRPDGGGKLHMQTAGALEYVSYNEPGTYSYEQLMLLIRRSGLGKPVVEQQFRRMVFNVVAGRRAIAEEVEVDGQIAEQIARSHRLKLPAS